MHKDLRQRRCDADGETEVQEIERADQVKGWQAGRLDLNGN